MKNKILGAVMGAALLASSSVTIAESFTESIADTAETLFAAENFSSTLTFTTDYVFRGTTFSNNDDAIQGSFDWGYGPWFAGMWGSSQSEIDDAGGASGATLEMDFYFGWADSFGGVDLMVMPLWYTYPGQEHGQGGRTDTTFELWTSAGYGFDTIGSPYVGLILNYSPAFFDCDLNCGPNRSKDADESLYAAVTLALSLPAGFGIDFLYGRQDVGGKNSNDFFADDYTHWNAGLTKSLVGFDFDLRYHDTNNQKTLNFNNTIDFASDRDFVVTVSRSF